MRVVKFELLNIEHNIWHKLQINYHSRIHVRSYGACSRPRVAGHALLVTRCRDHALPSNSYWVAIPRFSGEEIGVMAGRTLWGDVMSRMSERGTLMCRPLCTVVVSILRMVLCSTVSALLKEGFQIILILFNTSLPSDIKYTSQQTWAEQVLHKESLWWPRKYIPHFNRPRHRYLYTRMYNVYTQLPIHASYMITIIFGWVNRARYTSKWVALVVITGFELSTSCTGGRSATTSPPSRKTPLMSTEMGSEFRGGGMGTVKLGACDLIWNVQYKMVKYKMVK